jgi:hypothetical protein
VRGRARRHAAAAAALAAILGLLPRPGLADGPRIGERLYVELVDHNPWQFTNALRAADDFLKAGGPRRFEIMMAYYGIFAAIPGVTIAQRDYLAIKRRNPGLTVVACKETFDRLAKANRRRVPLLPGMTLAPCKGRRERLERDGWRPALGF